MSLIVDALKAVWAKIEPLLSPRGRVIVLLLVICALGTFYLQQQKISARLLLIPALFVVAIVIYLAFAFTRKWLWLVAILLVVGWGIWFGIDVTGDGREVRKLMETAAALRKGGKFDGSLKKYDEARSLAERTKRQKEQMECLCAMGDMEYLMSDYNPAKDFFQTCQQLAIQLNSTETKARAGSRLGDIARYTGDTGLAGRLLNEALNDFTLLKNIEGQAAANRGLGDVELRRNPQISRQHFETARQLYVQAQNKLGEADALTGLADLDSLIGKSVAARDTYDNALKLYTLLNESDGQGDVYRGVADLYRCLGHLDKAERNYYEALAAYQQAKDKGGEADVHRGFGDWAQVKNIIPWAREQYEQALKMFVEIGDVNGQALVLLGLGELEQPLNKETARQHYWDAYGVSLKTQSKEGQGAALRHVGDLEVSQEQYDAARRHYQQALEAYALVDNSSGQAQVYKSMGDLEMKLSNFSAAEEYYRKALELYQKVENLFGLGQIQKVLGDLAGIVAVKSPELHPEKIKEAQQHYELALQTYQQTDNKVGQAITLESLATVDRKQHEDVAAREKSTQATKLFKETGIAGGLTPPSEIQNRNLLLTARDTRLLSTRP